MRTDLELRPYRLGLVEAQHSDHLCYAPESQPRFEIPDDPVHLPVYDDQRGLPAQRLLCQSREGDSPVGGARSPVDSLPGGVTFGQEVSERGGFFGRILYAESCSEPGNPGSRFSD